MSTIRNVKKKNPFVQIDKEALQDSTISWKAKGLLAYLLSLPDDWRVYVSELTNHSKDGKDSTSSAIKELMQAGYITRQKSNNPDGTFAGYDYTVYESPLRKIRCGKPVNGKPVNGKPVTTNKENTNKENTNKERVIEKSPFPVFKSNCTLSSPICEKTGRMLYEDVYTYLINYLKENQHFVDGVRDRTRYKGEMAPILKKYLEYEQRQDEIYKIYPRTKEHEFNRWLSKILSGWQNFITNRIKWDKEKQSEHTETRFKDISTV